MAYVRDSDTSLWLHNKLGTSNDLWSSHSICSQLNQELLRKISSCFPDLQSQVKLKLILSILHIPRRNIDEWKDELKAILTTAGHDTDPWVAMLSELLRTYPDDGTLFLDPETGGFCELLSELRKMVKKQAGAEQQVLPEECLYLNKSAFTALLGQPAQPVKHFSLRKNPKSYTVKNEYLQKAREAQNTKRSVSNSSVPIRCRGLNKLQETPLRGLPSNRLSGSFKSPISSLNRSLSKTPSRKESGIKLLDITEQPMGRDAKRRKKANEDESKKDNPGPEKAAKVNESAAEKTPEESTPSATSSATPDYAAGLLSSSQMSVPASPAPATPTPSYVANLPSMPTPKPIQVNMPPSPATPSKTPLYVPGSPQTTTVVQAPKFQSIQPTPQVVVSTHPVLQDNVDNRPSYAASSLLSSGLSYTTTSTGQQQTNAFIRQQTQSEVQQPQTASYSPTIATTTYVTEQHAPQQTIQALPQTMYTIQSTGQGHIQQIQAGQVIQQRLQPITNASFNVAQNSLAYQTIGQNVIVNTNSAQHISTIQPNTTQYVIRQAPGGIQQVHQIIQHPVGGELQNGTRIQRVLIRNTPQIAQAQPQTQTQVHPEEKQYSLSCEQVNEAQEMFKHSNKVTRSEKALILGFIAGNRENPCPTLGDVITILLNENTEPVNQPDGSIKNMLVQTHFQMNYASGEWSRVVKHLPEGNTKPVHVIRTK